MYYRSDVKEESVVSGIYHGLTPNSMFLAGDLVTGSISHRLKKKMLLPGSRSTKSAEPGGGLSPGFSIMLSCLPFHGMTVHSCGRPRHIAA